MIQNTLIAQSGTVTNATLTRTLLDGASLYGIAGFDFGRLYFAVKGVNSEGLIFPYGQGAPDWGSFEMFTDGAVNIGYDQQWDLTGASAPTTYAVLTGSLPPGLALASPSGNTGTITGTPTTAGTYNFTLRATNAYGIADKAFSIVIVTPTGGGGAWMFID